MAAVLEHEPDWTALPAATPPIVQRLLRRCLDKDVKRRLKDIGDARLDIEDALASAGDASARHAAARYRHATRPRRSPRGSGPVAAARRPLGRSGSVLSRPARREAPIGLRRVSAELGTDAALVTFQFGQGNAAILSPDGALLAFIAERSAGAARQIYVRRLDQLQAVPLAGTEGALNPFFSPDSQWIAFFADGKLKKIPTTGGGAVTICSVREQSRRRVGRGRQDRVLSRS